MDGAGLAGVVADMEISRSCRTFEVDGAVCIVDRAWIPRCGAIPLVEDHRRRGAAAADPRLGTYEEVSVDCGIGLEKEIGTDDRSLRP